MARRKGISSNTNKTRGVLAVASQHTREPTTRDAIMGVGTENRNDNPGGTHSEKPREEFHALNNNNDNRYLHKKFKKMATAVQPVVLQVDVGLSRSASSLFDNISNQSTSHLSSSQEVPPARRTMLPSETSSEHALAPITMRVAIATAKSNEMKISDAANNVQINHKDYNDKRVTAIAKDINGGVSFDSVITNKIENKILNSGEIRETETNLKDSSINPGNGRHVCPYCKLSCAKPSVLQKHIRAHTNERPYPCVPCGFAFKTKSNLYKHCRSRSHALRLQGAEETANTDEEWSLGSEADVNVNNTSRPDSVWSNDKNSLHGGEGLENINELSTDLSMSDCISPFNIATLQIDSRPKSIYKPKFHKATFYQEEDETPKRVLSPNPDLINRHISKIISDNEAIVDTLMSPLNVKYSKDMINHKICHNDIISDSHDPLKSDNVPLNLTKNNENDPNHRKRCYSESFATPESLKGPQHPLNPEGSIIKDLLLKARAQATGLLPVTSETYDASETLYICPVCQIPYRSADNLEIHRLYYCKGNSVSSNATLNGALLNMREIHKLSRPEHSYIRSNSVHVTLPETYNPNTLAKLASSTLKCPSGRSNKPENLVIIKSDIEVAAPLPSPGPLLGNTRLIDTQSISESQRLSAYSNYDINLKVNMMSPISKQRTDSHSCESFSSLSKISEESLQRSELYSPPSKMRCTETPTTLRSLEELSLSPMRQNSTSLQMFGGEVKIVDTAGGTTTLRIEPTTSQHSPTLISQSRASPKTLGPETSSIVVRSGLHSGGTMVHNPPTPKEPLLSPLPQTPRLVVSMTPNISTPTLTVSGMPTQNITKFQFPPISSITAYNPLTLPPKSPVASPSGASTIIHGGKLIPYVPGIPGPNSLNTFIPNVQKMSQKMAKSIEALNNNFGSGNIRDDQNHFENIVNKALVSPDVDHNVKLQSPRSKFKISNLILNHNTEKREASGRTIITSPFIASPISPGLKFVPNVKMNYENAVSPKNLNSDFPLSKQSKAQNKIDSILRKNTEILQRSNSVDSPSNKILSVQSEHKIFVPYRPSFFDEASNSAEKIPIIKINEKEIRLPAKAEMRQFNFENLISKSEILNKTVDVTISDIVSNSSKSIKGDDPSTAQERSETAYFKKSVTSLGSAKIESQKSKFLRPTSLPLKPGTFTPKRHHGITPNANTLPLISPETPRPAKAYGQLYLNGHAYTYLGLKCSTKVYYCTLNRPQPTYVQNQHALSMYSNWQVCSEATPHPLGLAPGRAMSHYDSRHRPQNTTVAKIKQDHMMTHSSQWSVTVAKQQSSDDMDEGDDLKKGGDQAWGGKNSKGLTGGFESNEEYTYVRGRGRGRYVCYECGIRCKKPSMLKKHIRTHTDVRPFTCKHCAFSFKTKGNLTKHMKSKAHYKKCCELGISPLEDNEGGDMNQGTGGESDDDSESDDDGNEGETESSDTDSSKSRLEHEAAHCLLSLYEGRPAPGLVSSARPTTYPYTPNHTDMQTTPVDDSKPMAAGVITQNGEVIQSMIRKQCSAQTIFKQEKIAGNHRPGSQNFHPIDLSKPIDLSIADAREEESRVDKTSVRYTAADMLTPVGEPDLLVSLAMNTGKLPQRQSRWHDDEPMLQAYLTEKALQDSKIKQSQYANGRPQQIEANSTGDDVASLKNTVISDTASGIDPRLKVNFVKITEEPSNIIQTPAKTEKVIASHIKTAKDNTGMDTLAEIAATSVRLATPPPGTSSDRITSIVNLDVSKSTENAKFVASEYLKVACGKQNENVDLNVNSSSGADKKADKTNTETGSFSKADDVSVNEKDSDKQKPNPEHIGVARNVVVGAGGVGFTSPSNEFSSVATYAKRPLTEDGRSVCVVCNKTFSKPSQLCLHINIHFMERPFRCSACAVSFRTHGHLQKHERSGSHHNKVSMTSTFGAATTTNPRPFKCSDCKIAFRIHGHLAKHLRSKMHVMRLECLGKLPFGTFAEIERAGVSLTDIDTTDCDNSLASLQILAQKLHEKDPSKLDKWDPSAVTPALLPPGPDSSDDDEPSAPSPRSDHNHGGSLDSRAKTVNDGDSPDEMNVKYSATDT